MIMTMKINALVIISTLVLIISTGGDTTLIKVADSQGQSLAPSTVYKKFQPRVSQENFFKITSQSRVFAKIPGLTLVLHHAYPMLYELNFEAICRFHASGSAFELEFLYNDHTLRDNTFYRNDGSAVGSERNWWLNPLPSSHRFVCSRSETVYLAAGTYVLDVGARLNYYSQIEVFNGQLTVKLTQYDLSQTTLGNLPMLRVPQ
ncbi:unnamed protein product [Rotaria socialis]|uniref:Uncharacterized protein n=2 Tax=Rotaria socialis TaxID=392032 RepID=A0A820CU89_9BILA|nr:unnamed protein product [Rotaria socialis]CAF3253499.1 unnamed protein product [Rotaria socialis]CAF4220176.1 unnamed protein product [Rotaria socialis]CAF4516975.1 unnamed protein product [Rotaria socialis]CAF4796464.1 unnamed protein product [Rotaria socialis]